MTLRRDLEAPAAQDPPDPRSVSERKLDQHRARRSAAVRVAASVARRRLDALLDPGSFVELDMLARARAAGPEPDVGGAPGDGVVVGVGTIDGRDVAVYAFEPAARGASPGDLGEVTAEKIVKVQELALRSRIAIVGIDDPGRPRVAEGVAALGGYARVLHLAVRSSGVIPQLSVVTGLGGERSPYSAALADFTFLVAGQAEPPAGLAHFLAEDEAACWADVRWLLSYLPSSSGEAPPLRPTADDPERADPELQALVGAGQHLYDMRQVVIAVLDDREFLEVQPFFARSLLAGFGRLAGRVVGVVANQPAVLDGIVEADAASKAARFVRFCDAFDVPLITLVDTPGLTPERGDLARHGAQLIYAYAEATVPKLAVIAGRDIGSAYWAMSPRQLGADLSLAWPAAEIAVAGSPGPGDPYAAAERGYVDRVIEPRETRRELVRALRLCLGKTVEGSSPPSPTLPHEGGGSGRVRKHGNIPL